MILWHVWLPRRSRRSRICVLQQQPALWWFPRSSERSSSPDSHHVCIPPFHYSHICQFLWHFHWLIFRNIPSNRSSSCVANESRCSEKDLVNGFLLETCQLCVLWESPLWVLPKDPPFPRLPTEPQSHEAFVAFACSALYSITFTVPFHFHLWLLSAQICSPYRLRPSASDGPVISLRPRTELMLLLFS